MTYLTVSCSRCDGKGYRGLFRRPCADCNGHGMFWRRLPTIEPQPDLLSVALDQLLESG